MDMRYFEIQLGKILKYSSLYLAIKKNRKIMFKDGF